MGGLLIAGTGSGCGKTTLSMGIMAALKKRGVSLAPFKVGPDYIDPGFHAFVTGEASHNLDIFMTGEDNVRYIFEKYAEGKMAVVEGVMGMFDGLGSTRFSSSAHVAKVLDLPVVLVIDGKGVSTSSAAIVNGFDSFDENVHIDYVVVNRVSGEKHYEIIKKAIEKYTTARCIGYLPKSENLSLNSRHLGLIPHGEVAGLKIKIDSLANLIEDHIDLDLLIDICNKQHSQKTSEPNILTVFIQKYGSDFIGRRIGIADDIAFTFYYQANLDLLSELGATLVPFSPLSDSKLPENLDSVYIGGGFPEVFAKKLEENTAFRSDLKRKLDDGLKCFAECGGFMYLAKSIVGLDGSEHSMVGFFDATCEMTKRLQRFGYVTMNGFGQKLNVHEFHRSKMNGKLDYRFDIEKKREGTPTKSWQCGAKKQNVVAGYPHVHFYANLDFMKEVLIDG
jgi:cobyrinic acid a,c-diamide synthase